MNRVSVESAAVGLAFRLILARFDPPRELLYCYCFASGCWAQILYRNLYPRSLRLLWAVAVGLPRG